MGKTRRKKRLLPYRKDDGFDPYDDHDDFESLKRESRLLERLDPDLLEYFTDLRGRGKPSAGRNKGNFTVGDYVTVNGLYGTITYGPYVSDFFQGDTYEIEMENGETITAVDDGDSIKRYVPPDKTDDGGDWI